MFEESPFTGACSYATYEVIAMLVGTLLLGLILGYLIWGWLRFKLRSLEDKLEFAMDRENALKAKISDLGMKVDEITGARDQFEASLRMKETQHIESMTRVDQLQRELEEQRQRNISATREKTTTSEFDSEDYQEEDEIIIPEEEQIGTTPISLSLAEDVFGVKIEPNDLKIIEGVGPKIEEVLLAGGIKSWARLASLRLPLLRVILEDAGMNAPLYKPKSWPRQAGMAARGEWKKLKLYQEKLKG